MTSNNLGHALLLHTAYTQHKRVPVSLKDQESCLPSARVLSNALKISYTLVFSH